MSLQTKNGHLYELSVPENSLKLRERVAEAQVGPRMAIKFKCQECVGFEDTRNRIATCTVYLCPLWGYRPYQPSTKGER